MIRSDRDTVDSLRIAKKPDWKRLASGLYLFWIVLFILPLAACALATAPDYPEIPSVGQVTGASGVQKPVEPGPGNDSPSTSEPLSGHQSVRLRVAGNWKPSTVQLMANYQTLLAAQESTLTAEQQGGDQINVAWLAAYRGKLQIEQVPLPGGVLTGEQAVLWTAARNWPDLVQTQTYFPNGEPASPFIDLSGYLQDEPALAADRSFASLVHISQGRSFMGGVPYRVSLPVVFYNRALLDRLQLDEPPHDWTWHDFQRVMEETAFQLRREGILLDQTGLQPLLVDPSNLPEWTETTPIAASLGLESLLDFQPGMQSPRLGIAAWDGQRFAVLDQAFSNSIHELLEMEAQQSTLLDESWPDPGWSKSLTNRGQAIFWLGDSSDLATIQTRSILSQNNAETELGWTFLPIREDDRLPRYPVVLDTLAVSTSSMEPEAAAHLAVFMASDPNALLLATRLDWPLGTFPVIRDAGVWNALVKPRINRDSLLQIQFLLDAAFSDGRYQDPSWESRHRLLTRALADTLRSADHLQRALEQVDKTVNP